MFLKQIFAIIFIIAVASCTQKPADVIYNTSNFYGKNQKKSSYQKSVAAKEVAPKKSKLITVTNNETLYSISRKNQVSLRDLIKENDLSVPYNIKVGDHLKIPQNNYHIVQKGETIYSISRLYEMNINNLISLNNLSAPFELKIGQRLVVAKVVTEEVKKPQNKEQKSTAKNKVLSQKKGLLLEKKLDSKLSNFSWPINNPRIVSTFGPKGNGLYNDGVNIAAKEGDAVKSAEDGTIAYVGNELRAYGNLIIVKHDNGWITAYGHLSKTNVEVGDRITKSQVIGKVGSTGNVDKPQLYFGLRKGRDAVDPENYLK